MVTTAGESCQSQKMSESAFRMYESESTVVTINPAAVCIPHRPSAGLCLDLDPEPCSHALQVCTYPDRSPCDSGPLGICYALDFGSGSGWEIVVDCVLNLVPRPASCRPCRRPFGNSAPSCHHPLHGNVVVSRGCRCHQTHRGSVLVSSW